MHMFNGTPHVEAGEYLRRCMRECAFAMRKAEWESFYTPTDENAAHLVRLTDAIGMMTFWAMREEVRVSKLTIPLWVADCAYAYCCGCAGAVAWTAARLDNHDVLLAAALRAAEGQGIVPVVGTILDWYVRVKT